MTSTRCESCWGTGMAPASSIVSTCQFCGGHGWIVDPMVLEAAPTVSIHARARKPEELADFNAELNRRYRIA